MRLSVSSWLMHVEKVVAVSTALITTGRIRPNQFMTVPSGVSLSKYLCMEITLTPHENNAEKQSPS